MGDVFCYMPELSVRRAFGVLALALTAATGNANAAPLVFQDSPAGPTAAGAGRGLAYQLSPRANEDTVRVTRGGSWISYRLVGASVRPIRTRGDRAIVRSPLPRIDQVIIASSQALRDDLILRRGATGTVVYRVHVSNGLHARPLRGGVGFFTSAGRLRFGFARPTLAAVSAHARRPKSARYVVRRVSGGYVVKLVADEAWLERKLRDGMVVIDPEVSTGAALVPTPPVRASSEPGCSVEYYELEFQRWYCLYESPDVVDDGNGVNADASADPAQDAQDAPNSPSDADSLASPYPEDYADPTAYQTQLAITPGLAELAALASGHHTYDIRTVYAGEASGVTYLMRWGSTRFGYRHLVHRRRWSARTDARIALAFSQPYSKSYQGTSTNFYVYVQGSHKCLFKVVYQNAITTHDNRPKGLITAYAVVGTGCS